MTTLEKEGKVSDAIFYGLENVYHATKVYTGPEGKPRPRPAVLNRLNRIPPLLKKETMAVTGWLDVGYPAVLTPKEKTPEPSVGSGDGFGLDGMGDWNSSGSGLENGAGKGNGNGGSDSSSIRERKAEKVIADVEAQKMKFKGITKKLRWDGFCFVFVFWGEGVILGSFVVFWGIVHV